MSLIRQHTTHQKELSGSDYIPKIGEDRYFGADLHKDFWFLHGIMGDMTLSSMYKTSALMYGGLVSEGSDKTRINVEASGGFAYADIRISDESQPWHVPPVTKVAQVRVPLHYAGISNFQMAEATLDGLTVNYVKLKYLETSNHTRTKVFFAGTFDSNTNIGATLSVNSVAPTDDEILLATLIGNGTSSLVISQKYPMRQSEELVTINATTVQGNVTVDTVYQVDSSSGAMAFTFSTGGTHRKNVRVILDHVSGSYPLTINNGSESRSMSAGMKEEYYWTGTVWQIVRCDEQYFEATATDNVTIAPMNKRNYRLTFARQTTDKTITLPDATLCKNKKIKMIVTGTGAGNVLMATAGSQTIGGLVASKWTHYGVGTLEISSNGVNWDVLEDHIEWDVFTTAAVSGVTQHVKRYPNRKMEITIVDTNSRAITAPWGSTFVSPSIAEITFTIAFATAPRRIGVSSDANTGTDGNWISVLKKQTATLSATMMVIRSTSLTMTISIEHTYSGTEV